MDTILISLFIIASMSLASISTGIIISRIRDGKDIRTQGSGNAGGTNIMRIYGPTIGVMTMMIDALKAFVIVFGINLFKTTDNSSSITIHQIQTLVGILVILLNVFNPFLGYKGGKGVATGVGIFFAIRPIVAFASLIFFIFVLLVIKMIMRKKYNSHYTFIGSVTASLFAFFFSITFSVDIYEIVFYFIVFLIICISHRKNFSSFKIETQK